MPLVTITEPSADEQQVGMYNRRMRKGSRQGIDTGQKFAVCLIELAGGVNQPGDYAALKASVEAIAGIERISLLIDGQAPATIPVDMELRLCVEGHLRIDNVPVE